MKITNPDIMSVNGGIGSSVHAPPVSLLFLPENQDVFHASLGIKYEVPSPEPIDSEDLHFIYESNKEFIVSEQTVDSDIEETVSDDRTELRGAIFHEMTAVVVDTSHPEVIIIEDINETIRKEITEKQLDNSDASCTEISSLSASNSGEDVNLESGDGYVPKEFKFVSVDEEEVLEECEEAEKKNDLSEGDALNLVDNSYQEAIQHWQFINGSYKCSLCEKSTPIQSRIELHILRIHMNIKPFSCNFCRQGFCSTRSLMEHVNRIHDPSSLDMQYKCTVCGKQYLNKYKFRMHMNVHERKIQFKCHDCGKGFYYKYNMQVHIAGQHVKIKEDEMKNMCEYCGKSFKNGGTLRTHMRSVHRTGRQYACTLCSRKFSFQNKLDSHMSQHTGERAFQCEICLKSFRIRETLRRHLQTHFDPKPHACSICGLAYAQKDTLAEHMLKHQGVRKYNCNQCGKTFAQKSHLAAHKFVHQEKSFECSVCGAKFNRNDNMKAHMKRHFKDVIVKKENGVKKDKAQDKSNLQDKNSPKVTKNNNVKRKTKK